jgi:hypothetical protein
LKLVPLSLAEHAISWEVFRGLGRVPPLVVEFSERASGDADVLRKPLILNPAGTEGQMLTNAVTGNLSTSLHLGPMFPRSTWRRATTKPKKRKPKTQVPNTGTWSTRPD